MDKIIELGQDFEVLQETWHRLHNQLQRLNRSATIKLDMQIIENKINKIQSAIVNLDTQEDTQTVRTQKLANAHQWMDSHYRKTFERLASE